MVEHPLHFQQPPYDAQINTAQTMLGQPSAIRFRLCLQSMGYIYQQLKLKMHSSLYHVVAKYPF